MTKRTVKLPPGWDDLQALADQTLRQVEIADEISKQNPSLGITAYIIAGDRLSAERSEKLLKDGVFGRGNKAADRALTLTGSYARLDFAIKLFSEKYITAKKFYAMLPQLWQGSDTTGGVAKYLPQWKEAFIAHGRRVITDGKPLPKGDPLTIYRGQDRSVPLGVFGISWTLDRAMAESFAAGKWARQANRDGLVYEALAPRSEILAYLTGRGEREIIIAPDRLQDIRIVE